jgi:hypothetical protein
MVPTLDSAIIITSTHQKFFFYMNRYASVDCQSTCMHSVEHLILRETQGRGNPASYLAKDHLDRSMDTKSFRITKILLSSWYVLH